VELWAYILTRDYGQFLAIQQNLLVSVLQIVESSGTSIALPSQTLYLADQRTDREPESRSASASQR
jgi:MscS family membrane protein